MYVFMLSANTFCIAQKWWVGIAIFGFLLSFLWTVNVKRISVSNLHERLIYAIGAMLGGLLGVLFINTIKLIY